MSDYQPFYTFAVGDPETAGSRVAVACDLSLDEGSLIRCTFSGTPISSGTEYFANVPAWLAQPLADLLQQYCPTGEDGIDDGSDDTAYAIAEFVAILRRLADARIYAERGADPDEACILEGLEAHEPAQLFREIPAGLSVSVTSDSSWAASCTLRGSRRAIVDFVSLHWGDDLHGNEAFPNWLEDIRPDNSASGAESEA